MLQALRQRFPYLALLAALILFCAGSAFVSRGTEVQVALLAADAIVVLAIGFLMFRTLLSQPDKRELPLAGPLTEAVVLPAAGMALALAPESPFSIGGYLLGVLALAATNLPEIRELARGGRRSKWMAGLRCLGYVLMALAVLEITGQAASGPTSLAPGFLFQMGFGLWLILQALSPKSEKGFDEELAAAFRLPS